MYYERGAAMEYAIGVDIGGTKIHFAVVDRHGQIRHQLIVPAEAQLGPQQLMNKVINGIAEMIETLNPTESAAGIGIGSAGQIDFHSGIVAFAGDTLPGWTGMPIKHNVEKHFQIQTYVDNDVNVIAIAEQYYGAGVHRKSFICLALGTGVGGAIVEAGNLVRGAFGGAGELGHVSVDFNGPRCGCGNYGCIELYASGPGITRLAGESIAAKESDVPWTSDSRDVIQAWIQGDPYATQVMKQVIRALATAIGGYIHTFNPEAVIIGGGVSEAGSMFFQELEQEVKIRTSPMMREACSILPAYVGTHSGVIGAAAQVWHYGHVSKAE